MRKRGGRVGRSVPVAFGGTRRLIPIFSRVLNTFVSMFPVKAGRVRPCVFGGDLRVAGVESGLEMSGNWSHGVVLCSFV